MRNNALVRRWLLQLLLGGMALALSQHARAQDLPEYRLKAAFLYNFAVFTAWPEEPNRNLNLCIFGADNFGTDADSLNGKAVGEHKLVLHRKSTLESLKSCQIVFIAETAISQLPKVLDALRNQPVLTVADSAGAMQQGVMLNMVVAQGRITFQANLGAARRAGLTLSSKLLRLATEVTQ